MFVDYHAKTWWRKTDIMLPNPHPSMTPDPRGSTSPVCGPGLDITNSPQTTVASIRTAMSCGNMRIVGTQRINGVDAIKLAGAIKAGPRPHDQGSLTLWAVFAAYLVVTPPDDFGHLVIPLSRPLVEIPIYRGDLYVTALARHTPHP